MCVVAQVSWPASEEELAGGGGGGRGDLAWTSPTLRSRKAINKGCGHLPRDEYSVASCISQ